MSRTRPALRLRFKWWKNKVVVDHDSNPQNENDGEVAKACESDIFRLISADLLLPAARNISVSQKIPKGYRQDQPFLNVFRRKGTVVREIHSRLSMEM